MMHAHVYLNKNNYKQINDIRQGLLSLDWCLFVGTLTEKKVGPHPLPQFEIHFKQEDLFKAIKFLNLARKSLSVLVHSVSSNDLLDHTENALWLGKKLELDYSKLDKDGVNKALDRFAQIEY